MTELTDEQVLDRTIDIIRGTGHLKGDRYVPDADGTKRYCIGGAVFTGVLGLEVGCDWSAGDHESNAATIDELRQGRRVMVEIGASALDLFPDRLSWMDAHLAGDPWPDQFNNHLDTTDDDLVAVLEKTRGSSCSSWLWPSWSARSASTRP